MQVTFITKDGRQKQMPRQHAEILQKLGKGTYQTKDMHAAEKPQAVKKPRKAKEPKQ